MNRLSKLSLGWALALGVCSWASASFAATFAKISGEQQMGRIDLQNMKMNSSTDFVAISNSNVYAGNAKSGQVKLLMTEERVQFVLSIIHTSNQSGLNYRFNIDVFQSRLAINENGDFVIASNTLIWAGNVRSNTIRQVGDAGQWADIQEVLLNERGQYVVLAYDKILGGSVAEGTAKELLSEAVGNFGIGAIYEIGQNGMDAVIGENRIALNASGKFIAVTSRAVYYGDIGAGRIEVLHEESIGQSFRHVALANDDQYMIVSQNEVFAGTIAD